MEPRFGLFLSFMASLIVPMFGANLTCTVNFSSYICKHIANTSDLPVSIPVNIRKVTLFGTNTLDRYFPNGLFRNPTWANVSDLSILEFDSIVRIEEDFLHGLDNLKFLSISSCPELKDIHPNVFHSTPDLEALYLNDNPYLKLPVVEEALNDKLHKLKYISLIGIEAIGRHVLLGNNFVRALRTKNLTYIDLSGVKTIIIEHKDVQTLLSNVKYLNISYSTVLPTYVPEVPVDSYFRKIEFLDLTSCTSLGKYAINFEDLTISSVWFENIKYLFTQHLIDPYSRLKVNARYTFQNDVLRTLKVLDVSNNGITILNISFSGTYDFRALETLNISSNNLEYISPSLLSSFPSLKILDLSRNVLHKMQTMEDFSYLLSGNKNLEIIYLQRNYLSLVPSNLFSSNTKLRVIDLSDNELTYFNIDLHNTLDLTLIDLRKNRLKSMPAAFLGQVEQMYLHQTTAEANETFIKSILLNQIQDKNLISEKYKYGYNSSDNIMLREMLVTIPQYVMLNVLENPLICDCDTLDFVKWIVSTNIGIVNRTILTCKYNNKEELLNNAVMEMVSDSCRLVHHIFIAITSSVAIMVSIFALGFAINFRRRKARHLQDLEILKREILDDNTKFNFVVFLSYCSQDSHIVENFIHPSLNSFLKNTFNTKKDIVCTGAENFVPGMLIIEEIHRCINESLVIVPVITPAFLNSRWSLRECVDAIERHRQVVVLMKQHTDASGTFASIANVIGQYTRASWSYDEGNFVIRPSWNTICDGIIQTAIESFRYHINQHRNDEIELVGLVE
ncbi:hypothetical protein ACJMK2_001032 [Sinanodonta woodiana]|uniref:TIR domain-containing protein n=1 Tax=Sinanodonta woodiana TaxID=1069815 RepID=A0ABD3XUG7_SINWO